MDLDIITVEDTGFNLHADVSVGKIGLRPNRKDRLKIKKMLKDAAIREGMEFSRFEEKWFETPGNVIWVMGVR